jgi:flagellar motor switch protein FliG
METEPRLSGRKRAAIFLRALGAEVAAQVLRYLDDEEVASLTAEIAALGVVPPDVVSAVLDEIGRLATGGPGIAGLSYVRELLERAVGGPRARELMERIVQPSRARLFERLRQAPPNQVAALLRDEHPQVAALALAHLRPDQAAAALRALPDQVKADLARRIARTQSVSPELLRRVEHALERRLAVFAPQAQADGPAGGVRALVDIITRVDRDTERAVIGQIEQTDPKLAEEVKSLLFVFEDLLVLDDITLQRVLREVEHKTIALALKGTSQDVRDKVMRNLSSRVVDVVKEEMDMMGPVRLRDVEEARRSIVAVVRRLEEAGEITVLREEEQVVV